MARDEDLVEIETDKATMTYLSDVEGVLQVVVAEGTTVPVGAVIARIGMEAVDTVSVGAVTGPPMPTAPSLSPC